MSDILRAEKICKTFKNRDVVRSVSFSVEQGEVVGLLGPNGAGKTTTISMLSGLIAPTKGDAIIGGNSITKSPMEAKKLMGVIPQEIALYPELSARQNLSFFGKMYGLGGSELNKRVDEVLDFIDLKDRQKDRIDTFSGGMKRRVNIGVGLLHRPQLVHMDEPTVGIDPQNRRRILDTVYRLRDEYQMTVIYTTHLMEEAEELSDRVAIIDHGQIIALGTTGELTQQVGEEDRLFFSVGEQVVEDAVLERIRKEIPSVTEARFELVDLVAGPEPDETGEIIVTKRITGTTGAVHSGQTMEGVIIVRVKGGRKALPGIINIIDAEGIVIQSVEVREPDLEAVFLSLTGRALRD